MRQGEDRQFFDILSQMRLGEYNEEDEIIIKSRSIRKEDNPIYYKDRLAELQSAEFANAIYPYSTRAKTNERNSIKLKETATKLKNPIWIIQAVDNIGMARTSFFNPIKASKKDCKIQLKPSNDENECGSMFEQLPLCVAARVICRRNIDFDGGMVNGTEAIVKDIIWDNNDNIILPMSNRCVFTNLDRAMATSLPKYVELELDNGTIYKMVPEEVTFKNKNGILMIRRQLPLSLGYAITIHRSQCMTYNKLVVDLTGRNWKPAALNEMCRLEQIEKDYPIKIEQYLRTERYIDWCLPHLPETDNTSSIALKRSAETISNDIIVKECKFENSNLCSTKYVKNLEDIIIYEKQDRNYCGRHVLRGLFQRLDLFSDEYLKEIAKNLAATEQIFRHGESVELTDYYYESSGDYDIQILKAALINTFNIEIVQIHTLETNTTSMQSLIVFNIQNVQALIIQQNYHYYCLRRFRLTKDYFFKIDSKYPIQHEPIHREHIVNFLRTILEQGSNVYVLVQYVSDHINDQLSIDNIEK
ncbi:unnamed protein product, partial [Adineta steineri]